MLKKTIENGWSQPVLVHHIETQLHERQGKAITNLSNTLPSPQSDLAQSLLKDTYSFDFLTLAEDAHERHLEAGLLVHIRECQIVIFTCVPERYAFIGEATVVPL